MVNFVFYKVSKGAKIRNRYNQVPHQDFLETEVTPLGHGDYWLTERENMLT